MIHTVKNIGLPVYPLTVEDLPKIMGSRNFNFIQALDIESINAETATISYSASQKHSKYRMLEVLLAQFGNVEQEMVDSTIQKQNYFQ